MGAAAPRIDADPISSITYVVQTIAWSARTAEVGLAPVVARQLCPKSGVRADVPRLRRWANGRRHAETDFANVLIAKRYVHDRVLQPGVAKCVLYRSYPPRAQHFLVEGAARPHR